MSWHKLPGHIRRKWPMIAGGLVAFLLMARVVTVLTGPNPFPMSLWGLQILNGIVLGSVYALIALGYTLVFGILRMINFTHGDVMMLGAYTGFFVLSGLTSVGIAEESPLVSIVLVFLAGMVVSTISGVAVERIAYRPLRNAPRLIPLITAIGASLFMEESARLIFGAPVRFYPKLSILQGTLAIGTDQLTLPRTGMIVIVLSMLFLVGLYLLTQRTRIGKAIRAVSSNKEAAALMGIHVDHIIVATFAIGSLLAGLAGVMLGFHSGQIGPTMGLFPGIKGFTAAVLGGVGNIPGAMLGGILLGLMEAIGPTALDFPSQYKDVLAFSLLVVLLLFRPNGILGEVQGIDRV